MGPGEAVAAALDTLAAERTPYLTLGETVRELGGTGPAAEAFGVTRRTVQRWIKETPGQQRRLARSSPQIRATVSEVQRGLAAGELRRQMEGGFRIELMTFRTRDPSARVRKSVRELDDLDIEEPEEDEIEALFEAWQAGDHAGLASVFDSMLYPAWGGARMAGFATEEIEELIIGAGS